MPEIVGTEHRALQMLDKHSPTAEHEQLCTCTYMIDREGTKAQNNTQEMEQDKGKMTNGRVRRGDLS